MLHMIPPRTGAALGSLFPPCLESISQISCLGNNFFRGQQAWIDPRTPYRANGRLAVSGAIAMSGSPTI